MKQEQGWVCWLSWLHPNTLEAEQASLYGFQASQLHRETVVPKVCVCVGGGPKRLGQSSLLNLHRALTPHPTSRAESLEEPGHGPFDIELWWFK